MSCAICGVDERLFGHSKLCLQHFLEQGAERERENDLICVGRRRSLRARSEWRPNH
jgi:hypothetical protein